MGAVPPAPAEPRRAVLEQLADLHSRLREGVQAIPLYSIPERPEEDRVVLDEMEGLPIARKRLRDVDAEIQALETRLDKARQVKEGMMQNLLTGRIRLV